MSDTFDKLTHVFSAQDTLDLHRIEGEIEKDEAGFLRVADKDGKWQKGPSYEPPNLEPILRKQGMI